MMCRRQLGASQNLLSRTYAKARLAAILVHPATAENNLCSVSEGKSTSVHINYEGSTASAGAKRVIGPGPSILSRTVTPSGMWHCPGSP